MCCDGLSCAVPCHAMLCLGPKDCRTTGNEYTVDIPCPALEPLLRQQCCEESSQRQHPRRSSQLEPDPEFCIYPPEAPQAACTITCFNHLQVIICDARHEVPAGAGGGGAAENCAHTLQTTTRGQRQARLYTGTHSSHTSLLGQYML